MKEYEDGAEDDEGRHEHVAGSLDYEEEEEKKEPSGYNYGSACTASDEPVATNPVHRHRNANSSTSTNSNHNNSSNAQRITTQQQDLQQRESEMRGVHARTHLPSNTVCMSIPRKCLITVEMGQATPIGQMIAASDLDLDAPKHIYLMIYILWDRKVHGPHSFFHPYYEILPKTLCNMPIFWSPAEKAFLQGSYLLEQIQDRDMAITEDYQAICLIAPKLQDICTLEEFKWARMCVCSRNFGLSMDGHRTSALVPYADMLNHYRPRETKWTFDEDRQSFTITT
jgi:histone-lysine N-methyltransferase SETD3